MQVVLVLHQIQYAGDCHSLRRRLQAAPEFTMASWAFFSLMLLPGVVLPSQAEPNVVILLANNVEPQSLSCYGLGGPVLTPNIDRSVMKYLNLADK